jgi:Na+/H+ antiporter NhaD/arsenite permease-like protein
MFFKGNSKQGLFGATLGFFIGFAAVALFGPTANKFKDAMHLTPVMVGFLVAAPSLMPVNDLPKASWVTAFGLGFLSAVFDNIPLTALALQQGGYDWGFLAYAVGFGGSMVWFGSSAGVALASQFSEARSARAWVASGWHVAVGYVLGFAVLLLVLGWHPDPAR